MNRLFYGKLLTKLIFILALVLFSLSGSSQAATSPDAVGLRVIPNSDYLSPLRWYDENIKAKGSPQSLIVDGYEAVRDGRTVYVNAANISGADFFTNIYIISYNQQAKNATIDIFGQLLSHWRFNKNQLEVGNCVKPDGLPSGCLVDSECKTGEYCNSLKAQITRDTKRLSDLAEIKFILENTKAQTGSYPQLASGSYLANTSLSVWPSWKSTLAGALKSPLPIDPLNRLGVCVGFDEKTCWDAVNKKFADPNPGNNQLDFPADSFAYVYTAKNNAAYTLCALMESGFVSTESPDACLGSAPARTGREQTCTDLPESWMPNDWSNVCPGDKIVQTSNCGNTRVRSDGYKQVDSSCADNTCVGRKCDNGCEMIDGTKSDSDDDTIWTSSVPADQVCTDQTYTETGECGTTRQRNGTKPCNICGGANQPNCQNSKQANANETRDYWCPTGRCYKCPDNYTWNGTSCCSTVTLNSISDITINANPSGVTATLYYPSPVKLSQLSPVPTASVSSPSPVTYSLTGNHPAWLRINQASGVMSGEQTADNIARSYNVIVTATNSCGESDSENFTLKVDKNEWCGDGTKNGTEVCDGGTASCIGPLTGATTPMCQAMTAPGTLSCKSDCSGWETTCNVVAVTTEDSGSACDNESKLIVGAYRCCELIFCRNDKDVACCGGVKATIDPGALPAGYTSVYTSANGNLKTDECATAASPPDPRCNGLYSERTSNYDYVDCTLGRNATSWALGFDHSHSFFRCWK